MRLPVVAAGATSSVSVSSAVWSVLYVADNSVHKFTTLFTVRARQLPAPTTTTTATQRPSDAAGADVPVTECMPADRNLFDWLQSAFVDND